MTAELAVHEDKALYAIVDDLAAYTETLAMIDAQLAEQLPDDERAEIQAARAEVQKSRDVIGAALAGKTDAVAVVLRRLAVERDYIHEERGRLKAKELAVEAAIDWLRRYVVNVMQGAGIKQLKTAANTLFLRSSDAVEPTDVSAIPAEYMNAEVKLPLSLWLRATALAAGSELGRDLAAVRVHAEPSLSTIKKAIKSGVDVPGADLRLNTSLVCK